MVKNLVVWFLAAGVGLYSCRSSNEKTYSDKQVKDEAIMQSQDGTISLEVVKADTYHDDKEPATNTAEWNVIISKSGRYDVWLSSATKDTTRLKYNNAVMLSIKDDLLEAHPSVDKIIPNASDVSYPYYRADSFIGSLYLKDTGIYSIQVISDMIVPETRDKERDHIEEGDTKLISVLFTPAER